MRGRRGGPAAAGAREHSAKDEAPAAAPEEHDKARHERRNEHYKLPARAVLGRVYSAWASP